MISRKHTLLLSILLCVLTMQSSFGAVNKTLSYQGVLTQADGTIVPDDDYNLIFRLYDVDTGGIELWSEEQTVKVSKGVFNAIIGSGDIPLPTADDLPFDQQYWLGITVGDSIELAPRIALTVSPYSLPWAVSGDNRYRLNDVEANRVVDQKNNTYSVVPSETSVFHLVEANRFFDVDPTSTSVFHVVKADELTVAGIIHSTIGGFKFPDDTVQSTANTAEWEKLKGVPTNLAYVDSGSNNYIPKFTASSTLGNSTIYDNGNVGIGMTEPGANLDVRNSDYGIVVSDSSVTANCLYLSGNSSEVLVGKNLRTKWGEWSHADIAAPSAGMVMGPVGDIVFVTRAADAEEGPGTAKLRILNNGNVGIGTAEPDSPLDIVRRVTDGEASHIRLLVPGGNSDAYSQMAFFGSRAGLTHPIFFLRAKYNDNGMWANRSFQICGQTHSGAGDYGPLVTIKDNGNVGIGTPTPSQELDVVGDIVATGGNFGNYIGLFKGLGSLPDYPNDHFPTVKTDYRHMYFSVGGKYSAYVQRVSGMLSPAEIEKKTLSKLIHKKF